MSSLHDELVALYVRQGSAKRVMDDHEPDKSGRCPRGCGGTIRSGRALGLCSIYLAAKAAQAQAERRGVWKPC